MIINFLKNVFKNKNEKKQAGLVKSCSNRFIKHTDISRNALKVVTKLGEAGFDAYFVGGCVRDLLLNLHPKDFDIATNALPEQVNRLFRNSRLVGRRFRLAHVYYGREIIEVATFRGKTQRHHAITGMILRDNAYGTLEEDAWRRDFTVNALYYDIKNKSFIDYVGGLKDLKDKTIRVIGDPVKRYHEDPVRMLRALRLAAKLEFMLDAEAVKPIASLAGLLQNIPSSRLFDETLKWFLGGRSFVAFELLRKYGLFAVLFPQTEAVLINDSEHKSALAFISKGFVNSDDRIAKNKIVNPAFLFAILLWEPLQKKVANHQKNGQKLFAALHNASAEIIHNQVKHIIIPRYLLCVIKEIWIFQFRFLLSNPHRTKAILAHKRFKIAYDFLLLRAEVDEDLQELVERWTRLYENMDKPNSNHSSNGT